LGGHNLIFWGLLGDGAEHERGVNTTQFSLRIDDTKNQFVGRDTFRSRFSAIFIVKIRICELIHRSNVQAFKLDLTLPSRTPFHQLSFSGDE
jgi:hypothetical protein